MLAFIFDMLRFPRFLTRLGSFVPAPGSRMSPRGMIASGVVQGYRFVYLSNTAATSWTRSGT